MHPNDSPDPVNPQKLRTGLSRILHAATYSWDGLRSGWGETAFRQEAVASFVLIPIALWLGNGWVEKSILAGSIVAVLVVELLNTAVETAIDRIGPQWHGLSKRAKDMGSAAVLLTLLFAVGVWAAAVWARFG